MIPAEAVEAAERTAGCVFGNPVSAKDMEGIMKILEAAAPHLMRSAWDEGWEAGSSDETDSYWGPRSVTTPNPYEEEA